MSTETIFLKDINGQKQTQLFAFVIAAIISFVFSILLSATYFSRSADGCKVILDGAINPNTAEASSLVRLANIGPRRAEAIVKYRETVDSEGPAFRRIADMENIRGIGPRTAEKLRPWLCFE
ncbi:MAG TPA: helix-hairpin-helix domain-containing protein [Planctomycetes bacterium]|nr:helix-hairpin-helix domain-containing protein [Planctomycetota bacterium]